MSIVDAAEFILHEYYKLGELSVNEMEGSFTVVLIDRTRGRALLYRNLVGTGFTYYCETRDGVFFSSNLADLVRRVLSQPEANINAFPAFFIYRAVPGRETLFRDVYRLLPGEQVTLDGEGIHCCQRHTLGSYAAEASGCDAPRELEKVARHVIGSYLCAAPQVVNLLSGGIDSTYIQAHIAALTKNKGRLESYCAHLEHPRTVADAQYALTAAEALGVKHTLVPVMTPVVDRFRETIAITGEPLNHVQSAYFLTLARVMASRGCGLAMCGEGADSLFGVSHLSVLRGATALRTLLPTRRLKRAGARLAGMLRRPQLREMCEMADALADEHDPRHPLNQIGMFAHWSSVVACFTNDAIFDAMAARRQTLTIHGLGHHSMLERVHASGYLSEGVDTAALWTGIFNAAGGDLLCPYLDSRMLRFALSLRPQVRFGRKEPKWLLKASLSRYVQRWLTDRPKRGFGQPIFEWLSPGGELHDSLCGIDDYPFLSPFRRTMLQTSPSWFHYSALVYDLWYKEFISSARLNASKPFVISSPSTSYDRNVVQPQSKALRSK